MKKLVKKKRNEGEEKEIKCVCVYVRTYVCKDLYNQTICVTILRGFNLKWLIAKELRICTINIDSILKCSPTETAAATEEDDYI